MYPEPQKKTINELYFEALAASQNSPENTLGLNPTSPGPPVGISPAGGQLDSAVPGLDPAPLPLQSTSPSDLPDRFPALPFPSHSAAVGSSDAMSDALKTQSDSALTNNFRAGQESLIPENPEDLVELPGLDSPAAEERISNTPTNGWKRGEQTTVSVETMPPAGNSTASQFSPERSTAIQQVSFEAAHSRVTEIFEDTDVRQALQSLAQQAGVNLILDEQVNGIASAVIEDETFEAALRKILLPLGLVYRKTPEGEYLVASPNPGSPLFPLVAERFEYRPVHLAPDELLKLVPDRETQYLTVIDKRNLIVVEAPRELAEPILKRLQDSDTPIPQVELEAIVCVISPERGFRSGLDWGHAVTLNGSDVFRVGMAGLSFSGAGSGSGLGSTFSSFAVTSTFVKLLAEEGYLSIRAAPRVTARDGEQASISITRQSFFSTQPSNANQFFRQEVEEVEAGIELDITPVIRGDNITVKIEKAEVSEDIRTADINSQIANNPFPLINRRSVSTTVHVKNGETIVIGGLVQRQTVDRMAKVPILGDLPGGVGRLFQTVEQTERDAEVVIFISPRIVGDTPACGISDTSAIEMARQIQLAQTAGQTLSQPVVLPAAQPAHVPAVPH